MPTYKNIHNDDINELYIAVKNQVDFETGQDTPIEEIKAMVDEYLQGELDTVAILDDIKSQLDWIDPTIDDIDTAILAIPGFSIPAGLQTILTGMLQNQKHILQIERRELKAWRFVIKNVKYG